MISNSIAAGAVEQATRHLATIEARSKSSCSQWIPEWIAETRRNHLGYSREKIKKYVKYGATFYIKMLTQSSGA
jgi:hypothetical protein